MQKEYLLKLMNIFPLYCHLGHSQIALTQNCNEDVFLNSSLRSIIQLFFFFSPLNERYYPDSPPGSGPPLIHCACTAQTRVVWASFHHQCLSPGMGRSALRESGEQLSDLASPYFLCWDGQKGKIKAGKATIVYSQREK